MKINGHGIGFLGQIYLKNQQLWTEDMLQAIKNNESIQKKLEKSDIIGKISTKKERFTPSYFSYHDKGDTLYKVSFVVQNKDLPLTKKIKNFFKKSVEKYDVTRHYHSEYTVTDRISDLIMD